MDTQYVLGLAALCGVVLSGCASSPKETGHTVPSDETQTWHPIDGQPEKGALTGFRYAKYDPNETCSDFDSDYTCAYNCPSDGLHAIKAPLYWHCHTMQWNGGKSQFYWATACTGGLDHLTLIAGPLSESTETEPKLRGVHPPLPGGATSYQRGLCFDERGGGGYGSETTALASGFIYVLVDHNETRHSDVDVRFPKPTPKMLPWKWWPLIIRTPALPAGAYSTKFVLLSVGSSDCRAPLIEAVYRPNQNLPTKCEYAGTPNDDPREMVEVDAPGVYGCPSYKLTTVSCVASKNAGYEQRALNSDDQAFVVNVCSYVDAAIKSLISSPNPDPTCAPPNCCPDLSHTGRLLHSHPDVVAP